MVKEWVLGSVNRKELYLMVNGLILVVTIDVGGWTSMEDRWIR
jgi:hypothetical protein